MSELGEEIPVGITDKNEYFSSSVRSIEETLAWDQKLVKRLRGANNFLLGGCTAPRSLKEMTDFIDQSFCKGTNDKLNLYVVDIAKEAFNKINSWLKTYQEGGGSLPFVSIHLFQGDLLHLPIKNKAIDYIRLDFTQNFIPFELQGTFLSELGRVLSNKGVISDVVKIVDHEAVDRSNLKSNPYYKNGCIIRKEDSYNFLGLSRDKINELCKSVGLRLEWGESLSKHREEWFATQHVIMSKMYRGNRFFYQIKSKLRN